MDTSSKPIILTITVAGNRQGFTASVNSQHGDQTIYTSPVKLSRAGAVDNAHEWAMRQKHDRIELPPARNAAEILADAAALEAPTEGLEIPTDLARDHWAPNLAADQPGAIAGPDAGESSTWESTDPTADLDHARQVMIGTRDTAPEAKSGAGGGPGTAVGPGPAAKPISRDQPPASVWKSTEPDAELDPAREAELAESQETTSPDDDESDPQ